MRTNLYDVYDADGKRIIEYKTAKEISEILDIPAGRITKCGCNGQKAKGIYRINKVSEFERNEDNTAREYILEEWDKVRVLFKNVEWVKEYVPGVKRLGMKKVG